MGKIYAECGDGGSGLAPINVENQVHKARYSLYHGDCVEVLRGLPPGSVDLAVFSPPFESLYTYTPQSRDLGNNRSTKEFLRHFRFFVDSLTGVVRAGRMAAIHCMPLPMTKIRDGEIGTRDFPGDLIRAFQKRGWIYWCEFSIWKDPVTAMQRTKAHGLLYKTLKKDAASSRMGYPEKVIIMKAPGANVVPIPHDDIPLDGDEGWQALASPVWMDINPSDTLQYKSAREAEDERHICPLQTSIIRRLVRLWSNRGETVLSPFAGIGSEGVVSLEMGRRFIGVELKSSYYRQAVANLDIARGQSNLLDLLE